MMNGMMFGIEGYDDDPREVYSIAEIRHLYSSFHEAWPYWLYFCNLHTEVLRTMVFCCLSSIAAMKVDGRLNIAVEYKPLELVRFVGNDFGPMNAMCERAEMAERLIYNRSKAIRVRFKTLSPYDCSTALKSRPIISISCSSLAISSRDKPFFFFGFSGVTN